MHVTLGDKSAAQMAQNIAAKQMMAQIMMRIKYMCVRRALREMMMNGIEP
jgi:hypothetical protein